MTPQKHDRTTKAATTSPGPRLEDGCRECCWPVVKDLCLSYVFGRLMVLCVNPWACWERQLNVREHHSV